MFLLSFNFVQFLLVALLKLQKASGQVDFHWDREKSTNRSGHVDWDASIETHRSGHVHRDKLIWTHRWKQVDLDTSIGTSRLVQFYLKMFKGTTPFSHWSFLSLFYKLLRLPVSFYYLLYTNISEQFSFKWKFQKNNIPKVDLSRKHPIQFK
jgi:hypothetical protein